MNHCECQYENGSVLQLTVNGYCAHYESFSFTPHSVRKTTNNKGKTTYDCLKFGNLLYCKCEGLEAIHYLDATSMYHYVLEKYFYPTHQPPILKAGVHTFPALNDIFGLFLSLSLLYNSTRQPLFSSFTRTHTER